MLSLPVILFPLFLCLLYPSIVPSDATRRLQRGIKVEKPRVVLVTAHPDDEAMFFAPTLLGLRNVADVYALTLSNGNSEGLGQVREQELKASYAKLGVPEDRYTLVNHPRLQDNITAFWDAQDVAEAVNSLKVEIDTVITFDKDGISSHPNHISLFHGVKHWTSTREHKPRFYALATVPTWTKYNAVLAPFLAKLDVLGVAFFVRFTEYLADRLIEYFEMEVVEDVSQLDKMPLYFVNGYSDWWQGIQAMLEHKSQLLWFRYGWLAFSRYQWVNELVEVVDTD